MQALTRTLAVAALGLACSGAPARDIYKWTDANGKVHYGDRSAAGGSSAKKIEINTKTPEPAEDSDARDERTRKLLKQYEDEQDEAAVAKAEKEKNAANRKQNCERARDMQEDYRNASYLYDKDKDGNRIVLSNEDRAKAEADIQKQVDKWCKPLS